MTKHAKTADLVAIAAPVVAQATANRMTALDRIAAIGADMGTGDQSRISLALVLTEAGQAGELANSDAERAYDAWRAARMAAKETEANRQFVAAEISKEDGQSDKSRAVQISKFRTFLNAGAAGKPGPKGESATCNPVETLRRAVKVAQEELVRETWKIRTFDAMSKIATRIKETRKDFDEAEIRKELEPEGKMKDLVKRLEALKDAAEKIFHGTKNEDGSFVPSKEPFADEDLAVAISYLERATATALRQRADKYGA